MTYKINIKQDYNARIRLGSQSVTPRIYKVAAASLLVAVPLAIYFKPISILKQDQDIIYSSSVDKNEVSVSNVAQSTPDVTRIESEHTAETQQFDSVLIEEPSPRLSPEHFIKVGYSVSQPAVTDFQASRLVSEVEPNTIEAQLKPTEDAKESLDIVNVVVKSGESLARIFKRLNISATTLHNLMQADGKVNRLKRIKPGETLEFAFKDGVFSSLSYNTSVSSTLKVRKSDDGFIVETLNKDIEITERMAEGTITNSLYLAGKHSGISDKLIMELVGIYGWDIDFSQDIRKGDRFKILFQEKFIDGKKIGEGRILAAEFTNRGESLKALYFEDKDSELSGYYSASGHSMKKAFLRMPVDFARISSRFNLRRKHPVLNTIRAHKGVDYAAATGTPIKASGDGIVQYKGTKGGYGRTIILKHGGSYTTLYAHMSRYSKKVHTGKRVKQGDIIGYIGKSGLATGPHLHYEFRVNGVHRNPLTVKLPKALSIPKAKMAEFQQYTAAWLAQIDSSRSIQMAATTSSDSHHGEVVAMSETTIPDSKAQ